MKKVLLTLTILVGCYGLSFADFPAVKVYEKTAKSVVLIISKSKGTSSMIGAGSIISQSGIISTNAHVVIDKSTSRPYSKIRVYLKPDRVTGKFRKDLVHRHKAKIIAYDIDLDLAVLQAEDIPSGTGTIELADPDEIRIGEEAVAIGHPEQGGLWTLTYGRISGSIDDQNSIHGKNVFQTDASVNRGNSGGPLLDKRGYLIGINSNMARLGAGDLPITGVNFAVKSSVLKEWLRKNGITVAYGKAELSGGEKVRKAAVEVEMEKKPAIKEKAAPVKQPGPAAVKASPAKVSPAGPADNEKVRTPEVKKESSTQDKSRKPDTKPQERFQPHRKAYSYNALLKAVEEELEDMMEEMRFKINK